MSRACTDNSRVELVLIDAVGANFANVGGEDGAVAMVCVMMHVAMMVAAMRVTYSGLMLLLRLCATLGDRSCHSRRG